jgi:long-subunit fatty acid transport protein
MMRLARVPLYAVVLGLLPTLSMAQMSPLDVGLTLPPSLNFATSPNPVGSGARAAGKAFAFTAVADDATAASWNPAGLVQLQRPEASAVGSYFIRLEDHDITQQGATQGVVAIDGQTIDAVNLNYLSVVYPFELLRRNVVVSVNVQRLFDLHGQTDVAAGFSGDVNGLQQVHSEQEGGLWTISPALAVQITPQFSLGAAFNIWPNILGNGWKQHVEVRSAGFVSSGGSAVPFVASGRIREEYDLKGFNVTVGFLWAINRIFTVGGVFRSPFEAKLTHKHSSSLDVILDPDGAPNTVNAGLDYKEKLDMDMPLSYGIGIAARLSDNLTLSLDVSRVHWSDFKLEASTRDDVLLVENGAPSGKGKAVLDGKADDTTSVRVGAEYLVIQRNLILPLRAGLFYDPEPGDGGIDNFYGFTLGSGITVKPFVFDLAYQFRTGTVDSEAVGSTIYQHNIIASVICHF